MINMLVYIGLLALVMGMFAIGYCIGRIEEKKFYDDIDRELNMAAPSDLYDSAMEVVPRGDDPKCISLVPHNKSVSIRADIDNLVSNK